MIMEYILKWHKNWVFQLLNTNIQDIAIGITLMNDQTY